MSLIIEYVNVEISGYINRLSEASAYTASF